MGLVGLRDSPPMVVDSESGKSTGLVWIDDDIMERAKWNIVYEDKGAGMQIQ